MRFIAPLYDVWVVQLLPLSTLYEKVEIYFLVCVGENLLKSSLGSPHSPDPAHLHLTFPLCHDRAREIFSMSSERTHEMCIIWKFINIQLLPSLSVCFLFCGNLWDKFYDKIIFSWHLRRQQGSAKFVDECAMGGKFPSVFFFSRKMRCTCSKHENINAPFTHYKLRLIAESSMILFPVRWVHQAARSSSSQIFHQHQQCKENWKFISSLWRHTFHFVFFFRNSVVRVEWNIHKHTTFHLSAAQNIIAE